jgi:hypothetical protein
MTSQTANAAAQLAVQHQTTANPCRQGYEQQVAGLAVAGHKLTPGRCLSVIQQNRRALPDLRECIGQCIAVPK